MSTVPDPWRFYTDPNPHIRTPDLVMLFFQWFLRKVNFLSFMILLTFTPVFQKKNKFLRSHKTARSRTGLFSLVLLLDGRIQIPTNSRIRMREA
jgi:hypothetical protein